MAIQNRVDKQRICKVSLRAVFLLALCSHAMSAEGDKFSFLGEFSNVRHSADHEYGYSIQLWRDKDKLFGLFSAANGLAGDSPVGLLDDVQFDPVTGKLSFTAKLTAGVIYMGQGKQDPSHDLFSFKGSFVHNVISGALTHEEKHQTIPRPVVSRIRLTKLEDANAVEASSYEDWKQSVDPILKRRGPKW
jgi:hypothetical protein